MSMKEVADAITKYDNYLITSHVNMEGDALGSQLVLYLMLKQLGKKAVMAASDPVPERYFFMTNCNKIIRYERGKSIKFDTALLVDCPNIERTGALSEAVSRARTKMNIDHHVSNDNFGDFNWVDAEASSCGEMLFRLCREMQLNINEDMAIGLYVAIVTDTGLFRYDSTTSATHNIAGELLKLGVKPARIVEQLYEQRTKDEADLLARSLATLEVAEGGRIAYLYVTKEMLDETKTSPDNTEGFINFARSLAGAEIAVFFREDVGDRDKIHVGFRSKGRANVNILASKFGGGGHPKASGCRMDGPLDAAIMKVLKTAKEFLL